MRLSTTLRGLKFINTQPKQWWLHTDYIEKIINILDGAGLFDHLNYMVANGLIRIKSKEDILNRIKKLDKKSEYIIFFMMISVFGFITYYILEFLPPREYEYLVFNGVVNFFAKKYFDNSPRIKLENHDILYTAELPEGVKREVIDDDLYVITWCDDILDKKKLEQSFMQREDWVYNNFDLEIDLHFNEQGHEETTFDVLEDSFLLLITIMRELYINI